MSVEEWQPKTLAQAVVQEMTKQNLSLCCPDLAATIKQIGRSQDIRNFFSACKTGQPESACAKVPGPQPGQPEADDAEESAMVVQPGQQPQSEANDAE